MSQRLDQANGHPNDLRSDNSVIDRKEQRVPKSEVPEASENPSISEAKLNANPLKGKTVPEDSMMMRDPQSEIERRDADNFSFQVPLQEVERYAASQINQSVDRRELNEGPEPMEEAKRPAAGA